MSILVMIALYNEACQIAKNQRSRDSNITWGNFSFQNTNYGFKKQICFSLKLKFVFWNFTNFIANPGFEHWNLCFGKKQICFLQNTNFNNQNTNLVFVNFIKTQINFTKNKLISQNTNFILNKKQICVLKTGFVFIIKNWFAFQKTNLFFKKQIFFLCVWA